MFDCLFDKRKPLRCEGFSFWEKIFFERKVRSRGKNRKGGLTKGARFLPKPGVRRGAGLRAKAAMGKRGCGVAEVRERPRSPRIAAIGENFWTGGKWQKPVHWEKSL